MQILWGPNKEPPTQLLLLVLAKFVDAVLAPLLRGLLAPCVDGADHAQMLDVWRI